MNQIIVWNKKKGNVPAGYTEVYVGRPSVLGNPHVVGKGYQQGEAAAAYGPYLQEQLQQPGPILDEINRLVALVKKGVPVALTCHCAPKPCHAFFIQREIHKRL